MMVVCTTCKDWMILLLLFVLSWTNVLTQKSHFKPCPDQWTRYDTSCYLLNSSVVSLQVASDTCRQNHAHLVFIEDDKEQEFVKGFMDVNNSPIWLGARYDRSKEKWLWSGDREMENQNDVQFNQWTYGISPPTGGHYCSAVKKDGWWDFVNCSVALPFLCEKTLTCETGWYGGECSAQCHCLDSDPCNQNDGVCLRGCSSGWTGVSCSIANEMPSASFHCLKTADNDLRADLIVDIKKRRYRVFRAVNQEGEALPCSLLEVSRYDYEYFITLLLPAAFADVNSTGSPEKSTADVEVTSETSTSLPEVSTSQDLPSPTSRVAPVVGSVVDASSTTKTVGNSVTEAATEPGGSVSEAGDDAVSVTASYDEVTAARKRDVSGGDHRRNNAGSDCVASRSENGSVTWLIEFKEFPGMLTGNDVTVEVTCDLDKADSLEFEDYVVDNSGKGAPLEAAMMPVKMSVYLTDHYTGQRAERFHLGQRLRLHVDVEGLAEHECAFPHSCVVKPPGSQGQEVTILDKQGCGNRRGPVHTLKARKKGQFISKDFPAFTLGFSALDIECQVQVEVPADIRRCQTSCRGR